MKPYADLSLKYALIIYLFIYFCGFGGRWGCGEDIVNYIVVDIQLQVFLFFWFFFFFFFFLAQSDQILTGHILDSQGWKVSSCV